MRRAVLLLLAACGEDPSLRVEVTHHPDATAIVTRTTISVYESEVVSCAKVEFGDLTEAELTAIERDAITIEDGVRPDELTMSREGTKVIVARGFDEAGAFVTAGCEEKGVVGEDDVLEIATELTASVSVNGIGLDDADPFGIVVTVTDPFVRSLPDRIVSWRVHGSDGVMPFNAENLDLGTDSDWVPAGPACTNESGLVRVHPTPPSTIGGFATAVRTSWSTEPPRVFTTFTPVNKNGELTITPTATQASLSQRRCTSRISGSVRRLVCLQDLGGTPTAIDYTVPVMNGGGFPVEMGGGTRQTFSGLVTDEVPIGVFSIDRGETTRDAYAITTRGRIVGLFSPSLAAENVIKLAGTVTDVTVLPACGGEDPAVLVRVEAGTTKEIRALSVSPTATLGAGAAFIQYGAASVAQVDENLSINRTGCLAELQVDAPAKVRRVAVIDFIGRNGLSLRNSTTAFFDCASGICSLGLNVARAGVGFLPADDLQPERMVGASFDASGTVLSVTVLQPDKAGMLRLVELERITAASFPLHIVSGHFDGDGRPDLFWDISNLLNATSNFQLSYAHPVLGERLSALSGTQDLVVVDTFVADVTGDGHDDLVIASQDRLANPTLHEVLVIPGQVAIPPFPIQQDAACGSP
jgi:hypothetical protein